LWYVLPFLFCDREVARAGVQSARGLGVVFTAARELTVLQYLHYFFHARSSAAGGGGGSASPGNPGECPYFIAPVGLLTLTSGEFGKNPMLRRELLGELPTTEVGEDSTPYALKGFSRYGSADFTSLYGASGNGRPAAEAAAVVRHDLQYLAFPAVHLSLARVLGLNTPPSSPRWELTKAHLEAQHSSALLQALQENRGHLLPAAFAVELVRDLLTAVSHMIIW
jgi:hypothetical protein